MTLSDLPVELFLDHVLPALSLCDLLALSSTNKHFAALCSDDTFWKLKLHRDFNFSPNADTARESGWKVIYKGMRKPSVYTWGAAGQGRLGLSTLPPGLPARVSGVPFPAKVDINARIVSLVAGGWSFNALDDLGRIFVWGQLAGEGYALNSDGFAEPAKSAKVPHRLQIAYPKTSPPRSVKFTSVSCGRAHSGALDSEHNPWIFTSWGRPLILTSPLISGSQGADRLVVQVESGWGFVSMLTASGAVYVTWPFTEAEDFNRHATVAMDELDEGPNSSETKGFAREVDGEKVIPCTPIPISVAPLLLPPIPDNLPDLPYWSTSSAGTGFSATIDRSGKVIQVVTQSDEDTPTRLIRIGAGDNFIIGLTNRGHVLCIDLTGGSNGAPQGSEWLRGQWAARQRTGWTYMPEYSEIDAVKKNPAFAVDGEEAAVDGTSKPPAPTKLRITHISAHFNTFVAYSVSSATAPSASLVLLGTRKENNVLVPNSGEAYTFPQTIYPTLLENSVISLTLGDYHNAALTSTGKLFTWGSYSNGALGLGVPTTIPAGAPGGYATEERRLQALEGRPWDDPAEVKVPSEVNFDVAAKLKAKGTAAPPAGRKFVVSVAAAGWHTGALVIDLDGADEDDGQRTGAKGPGLRDNDDGDDDGDDRELYNQWQPNPNNRHMPGNWPHPPHPGGGGDQMETFETPPFNPDSDRGSRSSRSGGGLPSPLPPFAIHGPNAPIGYGPIMAPRIGYAGRGMARGGAAPFGRGALGMHQHHHPPAQSADDAGFQQVMRDMHAGSGGSTPS